MRVKILWLFGLGGSLVMLDAYSAYASPPVCFLEQAMAGRSYFFSRPESFAPMKALVSRDRLMSWLQIKKGSPIPFPFPPIEMNQYRGTYSEQIHKAYGLYASLSFFGVNPLLKSHIWIIPAEKKEQSAWKAGVFVEEGKIYISENFLMWLASYALYHSNKPELYYLQLLVDVLGHEHAESLGLTHQQSQALFPFTRDLESALHSEFMHPHLQKRWKALEMYLKGWSYEDISGQLNLSMRQVESYVQKGLRNLFRKGQGKFKKMNQHAVFKAHERKLISGPSIQLQQMMRKVVRKSPAQQREVFLLVSKNHSLREISMLMQIDEKTVKNQLQNIGKDLKRNAALVELVTQEGYSLHWITAAAILRYSRIERVSRALAAAT